MTRETKRTALATLIAALVAGIAAATVLAATARPGNWRWIYFTNDAFQNYDHGSSGNPDWPIGIMNRWPTTTKADFHYRACAFHGWCWFGTTQYLHANNDGTYILTSDYGVKTPAPPNCSDGKHARVYAPQNAYFYHSSIGRYLVISAHFDYAEWLGSPGRPDLCGRGASFGRSEQVERYIVDNFNVFPGITPCRECTQLYNWEPLRYDDGGTHIWLNSGLMSQMFYATPTP